MILHSNRRQQGFVPQTESNPMSHICESKRAEKSENPKGGSQKIVLYCFWLSPDSLRQIRNHRHGVHSTGKKDSAQDNDEARHDTGHLIESIDVVNNTDRLSDTCRDAVFNTNIHIHVFRARALHILHTSQALPPRRRHVNCMHALNMCFWAVVGGAGNCFPGKPV